MSNHEKAKKLIAKKIDQLSQRQKVVLSRHPWMSEIMAIGSQFGLDDNQQSILSIEGMLVMVGLAEKRYFEGEITKRLKISNVLATDIADAVRDHIFEVVDELLEKEAPISQETIKNKIVLDADPEEMIKEEPKFSPEQEKIKLKLTKKPIPKSPKRYIQDPYTAIITEEDTDFIPRTKPLIKTNVKPKGKPSIPELKRNRPTSSKASVRTVEPA